ncbi:MAG: DUF2442 domain-containing protein [Verrucomicrobia bacterium]|nr:DUF2442 domain-containing protein [Verrucomicrobiota bacterium]
MNDLDIEIARVEITNERLTFDLVDGRSISVPLAFYPTLLLASKEERDTFEVTGSSVYWPRLDCDLGSLLGAKEAPCYVEKAFVRSQTKRNAAA